MIEFISDSLAINWLHYAGSRSQRRIKYYRCFKIWEKASKASRSGSAWREVTAGTCYISIGVSNFMVALTIPFIGDFSLLCWCCSFLIEAVFHLYRLKREYELCKNVIQLHVWWFFCLLVGWGSFGGSYKVLEATPETLFWFLRDSLAFLWS